MLSILLLHSSQGLLGGVRGVCPVGTTRHSAPRFCASDEAQQKRRKAEQLALEAQKAALEAERAELELEQRLLSRKMTDEPASLDKANDEAREEEEESPMALQSPLRWIGRYPAVSLSFPELSSPAQKARALNGQPGSTKGVTLDFIIDTASNTNTINAQVAGPTSLGGLELQQVGGIESMVGAGGAQGGGTTFLLGGAELADLPPAERVLFISGLTATALPVASPAAAGLLGVPFLNSFPGGVEFEWGASKGEQSELSAPSITFFGDLRGTEEHRSALCSADVKALPGSGLPCVTLTVNGVKVPALLDTGSPITVLNAAAAKAADLQFPDVRAAQNLLSRFAAGVKRAASPDDILTIAGANGPVQLARSQLGTSVSLGKADFGEDVRVYVGDIPGLSALEVLGAGPNVPAAILGTDVLRRRPRMIYTTNRVFL
ncbi:MAG: hypothetical protein SGPRY_001951 [Prymnesium sp.]